MERLHATIYGRVQGVNFRATTQQKARRLDLTGWVRNNPDGTVEVIAEGQHDKLEDFADFLAHGPSAADVDSIEKDWTSATTEFQGFKIRY